MSTQLDRILSPNGAAILDGVRSFVDRFCAFPDEHCLIAVSLWAAHAHMVGQFHVTPRLALLSPEPASGKTRVLEVLELLTPESMLAISPSPAPIFRTLEEHSMTLLFDEVDAVFKVRGKSDTNEDLRALLNAGYKRGASILRCVGPKHEAIKFPVFCPVALAGLGDLPDTIMSRSIIIRMRRRAPNERVEEFRIRRNEPEGHAIRSRLEIWAEGVSESVGNAEPTLPVGVQDRPAEIWEPLIAIADAAGGVWPELARASCSHLVRVAEDRSASLGLRLLADLRTVFGDTHALHTETIITRLCEPDRLDSDAPWSNLRGEPIDGRILARMLKPYGIKSQKVSVEGKSLQGYRREMLWDPWERYLPPLDTGEGEHPEPAEGNRPDIPHIPLQRGTGSACRQCDGEGCSWCDGG